MIHSNLITAAQNEGYDYAEPYVILDGKQIYCFRKRTEFPGKKGLPPLFYLDSSSNVVELGYSQIIAAVHLKNMNEL